jgi:uncharacterized protein DUF6152
MNGSKKACLIIIVALALVPIPLFAHHGTSAFDMTKRTTVKGTVTAIEWSNPHVFVHFDVNDGKGDTENWAADSPNPTRLAKAGWNKDTLKLGDQVTATGNRAKNGSNLMRLAKIVRANGQELTGYTHF